MPNAGVLIFFAVIGSAICTRSRFAGGAVLFAAIAVVLFISTPVGSGLPGAVSSFLTTLDHSTTPALNGKEQG